MYGTQTANVNVAQVGKPRDASALDMLLGGARENTAKLRQLTDRVAMIAARLHGETKVQDNRVEAAEPIGSLARLEWLVTDSRRLLSDLEDVIGVLDAAI